LIYRRRFVFQMRIPLLLLHETCSLLSLPQYVPLQNKLLGKGAYGQVCAVKNNENGERLAVKKVKNAFDDVIDAKRVLREIRKFSP
jgi:hypothetical protein